MKCTNEMMCLTVVALLAVLLYRMLPRDQRILRAPGGSCMAAMQAMMPIKDECKKDGKKQCMQTVSAQAAVVEQSGCKRLGQTPLVLGMSRRQNLCSGQGVLPQAQVEL